MQVQGKCIPLYGLYLFCLYTEVTPKRLTLYVLLISLWLFSDSVTFPALCFPCQKEHLMLWVLSKFESEFPLTLFSQEFSKVQQASGLWAATKPSLLFRGVKPCSEFTQPFKLAKYYAVINLQSSWARWWNHLLLRCSRITYDCLIACLPCNQLEVAVTENKCWESHPLPPFYPGQGRAGKCAFFFKAWAALCCAHVLHVLQGWGGGEKALWYGNYSVVINRKPVFFHFSLSLA